VAATRRAWSAQDSFVRADGSAFPVQVSAAPIIDNGEAVGVVVGFTDITDRRKLEAKLEQANRISSLGRLAATIAHEFNNVLMGIAPFVDVMRGGKNLEASLDHIGRAVARGRRITQDILRFTQPAQPSLVAVEVEPWLQGIAVEARSLLSPLCTIEVKPCGESLYIDGDPTQLQQIFTNLILNARDAMPLGGRVTIEVRRESANAKLPFVVAHPERFAHLVVRDTGCGMNAEMLRNVFEPLFTTKRNGTGLGLPVALQVVQRHGGEMFVESTPGAGTTFHLFLPLAAAPAVSDAKPAIARATVARSTSVLLVEDDATVAAGIASLLELEGMRVDVAGTGTDALSMLRRKVPHVVILDVGLPDIDGTAVYAEIARTLHDLPVIFSTGHADLRKLDALVRSPHVGFLPKPYDGAALLKALTKVMASAKAA
jgi:signal transduction histidine kinase/ActR/RegA family two-component response regulator